MKLKANKATLDSLNRPSRSVALDEKRYRVPEAGEMLGLAQKTMWAWIGARKIGVHRIGRSVQIPESEIQRILDEGFTPPKE